MSLKTNLIESVKKSSVLYTIYYYTMSVFVNVMKIFVRTDPKLILFVSYGGRHYNDSPKVLYEEMQKDQRFSEYKFVWAFRTPENIELPGQGEKVKIDTLNYYKIALKSRVWITNVMIERALKFCGKDTFYLHTTHTVFPKKMALDSTKGKDFKTKNRLQYDYSCAQSEFEGQMQMSMFGLNENQILLSGYPKNDLLANAKTTDCERAREKLGIPKGKKVILYAPTYREDNPSIMVSNVDFNKWESILGEDYFVLYRAHPTVADMTNITASSSFIKNVSRYPDNVEIMLASDILISDYSGIFFEYAVLERPMYCYGFDYDQYTKSRELYFDIRDEIPGGRLTERDLLIKIKEGYLKADYKKLEKFRKKYVNIYGNATQICLNKIWESISLEK